jgi:hypothetical protein
LFSTKYSIPLNLVPASPEEAPDNRRVGLIPILDKDDKFFNLPPQHPASGADATIVTTFKQPFINIFLLFSFVTMLL